MRNRTTLALVIFGCFFSSGESRAGRAYSVSTCGIYKIEGYLTKDPLSKERISLRVNSHSESEFRVALGDYSAKDHADYIDTKVRLLVGLYQKCYGQCTGKFLKIEKRLDPWAHPAVFLASYSVPVEKTPCSK